MYLKYFSITIAKPTIKFERVSTWPWWQGIWVQVDSMILEIVAKSLHLIHLAWGREVRVEEGRGREGGGRERLRVSKGIILASEISKPTPSNISPPTCPPPNPSQTVLWDGTSIQTYWACDRERGIAIQTINEDYRNDSALKRAFWLKTWTWFLAPMSSDTITCNSNSKGSNVFFLAHTQTYDLKK